MNSLIRKCLAAVMLTGGLLSLQASHAAQPQDLKGKNVVLVHGAFADGSSWDKVIPLLEARGLHVVAVQNPLSSLADDAAATKRAIDAQQGPVVLVGHSWGGVVISEAGNDEKVKALVYVAAFAPDSGQSLNDMIKGKPAPAWASELQKDSGNFLKLSSKAIDDDFAQDLNAAEKRVVAATQGPWFAGCTDDKVTDAAWRNKPSYFVVANKDRMIDPRLQDAMAAQIKAHVTHVDASHVAMLSQPRAVADAIIAAASRAQ
ncbi:alpha/beta fold hydrolase [Paraburkholderia diazotrophica]|uniref:Pimeloyl-ACP methyl ester carboxylesterase n=1 Tax=Paraburkholderia diazotrophica TaxID=667676 RepID=A0A1H6YCE0_9BURK|nr:alpha/beta hydrolase [Paraburkholderia diazotrophica]SEJ34415.1 Pimeloyl-ACP methyl ester carboxylesterase [Paraburkholderia diazotrophica]